MQELQAENSRLHRLLDIFDCQPDYAFCATSDGTVTFVNDRLACLNFYTGNGGAYPNNNVHDDDDPHGMKGRIGRLEKSAIYACDVISKRKNIPSLTFNEKNSDSGSRCERTLCYNNTG